MAHLHCQITQHSYFPFTIKLFFKSANLETISVCVCSSSPPSQCNNTAEMELDGIQHDWTPWLPFWPASSDHKTTRSSAGTAGRHDAAMGALIYSKRDHLLKACIQGSAWPSLASIWHGCEQHVGLPHEHCPSSCRTPNTQLLLPSLRPAQQIPLEISQVVSIPERILHGCTLRP